MRSVQYVSFFYATSVRNISRSDKYLASYAPDACRKETCGCVSLLDVSAIFLAELIRSCSVCVFSKFKFNFVALYFMKTFLGGSACVTCETDKHLLPKYHGKTSCVRI
jgi:hypothetical protein